MRQFRTQLENVLRVVGVGEGLRGPRGWKPFRLQPHPHQRPRVIRVLQRPQRQKQFAAHAAVGAVVFGRFVIDDFVRAGVVTQHQPKVLRRVGSVVIAHADDRRRSRLEISTQGSKFFIQPRGRFLHRNLEPDGARVKAAAHQCPGQVARVTAAPQCRDPVRIDRRPSPDRRGTLSLRRYIAAHASPQKSGFWRTCGTLRMRNDSRVAGPKERREQQDHQCSRCHPARDQ